MFIICVCYGVARRNVRWHWTSMALTLIWFASGQWCMTGTVYVYFSMLQTDQNRYARRNFIKFISNSTNTYWKYLIHLLKRTTSSSIHVFIAPEEFSSKSTWYSSTVSIHSLLLVAQTNANPFFYTNSIVVARTIGPTSSETESNMHGRTPSVTVNQSIVAFSIQWTAVLPKHVMKNNRRRNRAMRRSYTHIHSLSCKKPSNRRR